MTPEQIQKYAFDKETDILKSMPITKLNIHNYGGESINSVNGFIPSLEGIVNSTKGHWKN